jgi:hypothetical protein
MGIVSAITAIEEEAAELRGFAAAMAEAGPGIADAVAAHQARFEENLAAAWHPMDAELAAEAFLRSLRHAWLARAGEIAARSWRSPTAAETRAMEDKSRHDAFGYERDLHPEQLEQRCREFFAKPPAGWCARHLVFASGQAAMASCLLALDGLRPREPRPMRVAHIGAYFETARLLRTAPSLAVISDPSTAHVLIIEPVSCGGAFAVRDPAGELRRLHAAGASPQAVIVDATLLPSDDDISPVLAAASAFGAIPVIRIASGLKLLQSGFELANVGLASVHAADPAPLAGRLADVRTLTGAGIGLADEIALSAPWFLDREAVQRHERAVFEHNAALAAALAGAGGRFEPAVHPSLRRPPLAAPYCAFRLREPSPEAYDALEIEVAEEAERRRIALDKGGSFGFRGHRFEVVRPETGEPSFLRIAMGRRAGWSREGVIVMMADLAAR